MNTTRPLCILIGALGGQGGGVLVNWLVAAARLAGCPAQATSVPGAAQRTGATTYYFELFPEKHPATTPLFCLFPSQGDVDLVIGLEPTEAGRALERGYVTTQTAVITSTRRLYSVAEKSVAGDGIVTSGPILESLRQAARLVLPVEPALAAGSQLNAVIFGAIIGCGLLPLTADDGRAAIAETGLAVAENLAGFEAGLKLPVHPGALAHPQPQGTDVDTRVYDAPPEEFMTEVTKWPEGLRPLLGHALAQLVDYQDVGYGHQYLARLQPVLAADEAVSYYRLTTEVARRLAAWMCYEDVVRVAQLKTRPGRLGHIRAEMGAAAGEPITVHDYLSPGWAEFAGLLPAALARLVPGGQQGEGRSLHLAWPTSSPWGFGLLKVMAGMRRVRPYTAAFKREQAAIEQWLTAVLPMVSMDYELACMLAETAVLARGYGPVRARGLARLNTLLTNWPQKVKDMAATRREVTAVLHAARYAPDTL